MATEERVYLIRVSAVLDRSTAAAAGDFVQQFERSNRTRERQAKDSAAKVVKVQKDAYETTVKQAAEANQSIAKEFAKREATESAARQRRIDSDKREFDQRLRHAQEEQRRKERDRREEEREIIRTAERARRREEIEARQAMNERKARVRQMASDVYRDVAAIGSKALGVGKELAGGFGVNFDVGSGIAKAVQLQKMAVGIVNAGNRGGGSPAERDAEVTRLQNQARSIGNTYAFDPTKMLAGYAQFQAKTGDTATASAGLERFAKLAKAFNVELDDMISAAGEISSKLEDSFTPGEKRAQKTYEVLKLLTAQGQEGAIEIADLAKETARLGGGAGFFKGDIGTTIGHLGALAQLTRQTGGANSAADAARAVAAFVTQLKTPARRDAMKKEGVEFTSEDGSFLDPLTIIKNALVATNGDTERMNNMFKSSLGTKPVDALAKAYRAGGGDVGGLAEVDKLWAKFTRTVDEGTIDENAKRAMGTAESKAQLFQNKLDAITASLAERVLPALERLAPKAEGVMKAFADLITYVSESPGRAITLAIVGSIAKAAIGPAITNALVGKIAGQAGDGGVAGAGVVGKGLDPTRKVMGMQAGTAGSALGSALTIAAVAVTTFTVGSMVVDKFVDSSKEANDKALNDDLQRMESADILIGALKKKTVTQEDIAKAEATLTRMKSQYTVASEEQDQFIPGSIGAALRAAENYVVGGPDMATLQQAQKENLPELKASIEAQEQALNALKSQLASGTITIVGKVEVTNAADFNNSGSGGNSSDGRTGVPD